MSKMHHECAIVGIFAKDNKKNVLNKAIFLLSKLQHRGQDSAGVCYIKNNEFKIKKDTGLIQDVLKDIKDKSNIVVAHTRYATFGEITKQNAQPVFYQDVSLVHNGTIFEIHKYKEILIKQGFVFEGTNDSEVILKWLFYKIKKNPNDWSVYDIKNALKDIKNGAYCLIIMFKERLIALKDEFSYRPLMFIETKNFYCFSSEDTVSKAIKKKEIKGDSVIEITKKGYKIFEFSKNKKQKMCPFETIYFARHNVFKKNTKKIRMELGKILSNYDKGLKADFIVPVLKSGYFGAKGYKKNSKIKYKELIVLKNPKRTFIENNSSRKKSVDEKYLIKNVKGKDVVLIDDSIVRGTTAKKIIEHLKKAGANKIHLRLTSPMIVNSCFWGVDIPDKNELLAYKLKTQDNIKKELDVESVKFITFEDFFNYFDKNQWCNQCFKANTTIKTQELT